MARKLSDLAHIKEREQEWAEGIGSQFGCFLTICRQEATARKSLIQMVNSRDKPAGYEKVWETTPDPYTHLTLPTTLR